MATPKSEIRRAEKIVNEIRAIRRKLWRDAGGEVDAILKNLDRDLPWDSLRKAKNGTKTPRVKNKSHAKRRGPQKPRSRSTR